MVLQICRKYVVIEKFNNMSVSFRCRFSSEDIRDGEVRARAAGIEQMAATSRRQCSRTTTMEHYLSCLAVFLLIPPRFLRLISQCQTPRRPSMVQVVAVGRRRLALPHTTRVYGALPAARREPPNLLPLFTFMIIGPHLQHLIEFLISFLC